MLPTELLSALKAYALSKEILPTPAPDPSVPETPLGIGQTLQAAIVSEVSSGIFTVKVEQQLVQMQLPQTVHAGDTVELQVLSLQPRLTFSMVSSSNPLSTSQQLSHAARMLSALSGQAQEKAWIQAADQPPLMAPVATGPEVQPLAQALKQVIMGSGLFYESHQAQWVGGERTVAQLMLEPQNSKKGSDLSPPPAGRGPVPPEPFATGATATTTAATAAASPSLPASSLPPHLQSLVQQQLNVLETGRLLWQGQVFPQQQLTWEIWQEPGHAGTSAGEAQDASWMTTLHLDLPRLGTVEARMQWTAAGMNLVLRAAQPSTQALMQQGAPELVSALGASGVTVASARVKAEP